VLNYLSTTPWRLWGSGCIDLRFIDLSTSWRWVIRFTPLLLYPLRKSPRYSLDRIGGWVGPEPVWTVWRSENSWPIRDSNSDPSVFNPVASFYTEYTTTARVRNVGGWIILKWILDEMGFVWTVLIWLRIGTCGGLLWAQ
jgi:hypothetical protein